MATVDSSYKINKIDTDEITGQRRFLAEDLSDPELLAMVLGGGLLRGDAVAVARDVLQRCEQLAGVRFLPFSEISEFPGVGVVGAQAILVSLELGYRVMSGKMRKGPRISTSQEVDDLFRPLVVGEKAEIFYAALADSRLCLIKEVMVARGSLTASVVHPREAYLPAVRYSASGVIFVHNHPSGDPGPSREDHRLTRRLVEVGALLGIPMLDHVIIASTGFYSFADAGHIEAGQRADRGEFCSSSAPEWG